MRPALSLVDLPRTGGAYKVSTEDFRVEEVPAYVPSGEGPHTYLWIEKRGVDTRQAVSALARALGVEERDCGTAGLKDRHAVTRQWVSVAGADPEAARALDLPGIRVLAASRHGNKLKTGHLRGNRFEVAVRGACEGALMRAEALLAALTEHGLPNFYGAQRFGRRGDNAEGGLALVRGEHVVRDSRKARLLVSALQSDLFNAWLEARLEAGALRTVRAGDLLCRAPAGAPFASTDPATDQARVDAWEVVPTGPMPGWKMPRPPEGSAARAEEDALLEATGLSLDSFANPNVKRFAEGTRRAAAVRPVGARAWLEGEVLWLTFSLPPGSYATVLLDEVVGRPLTSQL